MNRSLGASMLIWSSQYGVTRGGVQDIIPHTSSFACIPVVQLARLWGTCFLTRLIAAERRFQDVGASGPC
jgi:hypothetical protein